MHTRAPGFSCRRVLARPRSYGRRRIPRPPCVWRRHPKSQDTRVHHLRCPSIHHKVSIVCPSPPQGRLETPPITRPDGLGMLKEHTYVHVKYTHALLPSRLPGRGGNLPIPGRSSKTEQQPSSRRSGPEDVKAYGRGPPLDGLLLHTEYILSTYRSHGLLTNSSRYFRVAADPPYVSSSMYVSASIHNMVSIRTNTHPRRYRGPAGSGSTTNGGACYPDHSTAQERRDGICRRKPARVLAESLPCMPTAIKPLASGAGSDE